MRGYIEESTDGKIQTGDREDGQTCVRFPFIRRQKPRIAKPQRGPGIRQRQPQNIVRRAQRRAQASNLGSSVALAGVGLLVIALVLVRGEGGWLMLRNVLFGIFGVVTYLVGPFLLYLAYLVPSGYGSAFLWPK